ncbi:MAG TPA: hypothetical protein VE978_16395 [Chitinophagales bacterium]|nr:hypothetical protein [Chitinophagales bacterium]
MKNALPTLLFILSFFVASAPVYIAIQNYLLSRIVLKKRTEISCNDKTAGTMNKSWVTRLCFRSPEK